MINIDTANLAFKALNTAGCYMVGISTGVNKVLLNGSEDNHVFYCDINSGFAIINKTDVSGKIVTANNEILYELFFGKVEVIHELEKPTN